MSDDTPELVAVIELGTSSIRMEIAQISDQTETEILDFFQQPVSLGKDTFTFGKISSETIESCVTVLKRFRAVLDEYGIHEEKRIKALATSAVREASNRDAFLDRIFIATGIAVEALDEAEVNRLNCMAIAPLLNSEPSLKKANTMVVEVGGGSTELLIFEEGQILSSHAYRLGSLRLQKMFEEYRTATSQIPAMMQAHIERSIQQMFLEIPKINISKIVILGGDARFAASLLKEGATQKHGLSRLMLNRLNKFTKELVKLTPDDIVKEHNLAYPDAETLAPALLIYVSLAKMFKLRSLFVGKATLREGALADFTSEDNWTEDFKQQVVHSAIELGQKYSFDQKHALNVAHYSLQLFDDLVDEHKLGPRFRLILHVAAILHDVGSFISTRSHHKHSLYLIINSDLFGLGTQDLLIASLVARYHRRATPKISHVYYGALNRSDRITVSKLAAILRVADAIDRRHIQSKRKIQLSIEPGTLTISIKKSGDLSLEKHGLKFKADLFEQVYGMQVNLQESQGGKNE